MRGDRIVSWSLALSSRGWQGYPVRPAVKVSILSLPRWELMFAQFNNTMAVLGKYNYEMTAVLLIKSSCVLSLLVKFGHEKQQRSVRSVAQSVKVALKNAFRKRTHSLHDLQVQRGLK